MPELEFVTGTLVLVVISLVVAVFILSFIPLGLWISAKAAGVKVGIIDLIGMRLRRIPPKITHGSVGYHILQLVVIQRPQAT